MVAWNNARSAALLVTPPAVGGQVPELGREVDRLLDLACNHTWTRLEFRQQRTTLGRMAAEYLRVARQLAGLPDIHLPSIWTWDVAAGKRNVRGLRAGCPPGRPRSVLPPRTSRARTRVRPESVAAGCPRGLADGGVRRRDQREEHETTVGSPHRSTDAPASHAGAVPGRAVVSDSGGRTDDHADPCGPVALPLWQPETAYSDLRDLHSDVLRGHAAAVARRRALRWAHGRCEDLAEVVGQLDNGDTTSEAVARARRTALAAAWDLWHLVAGHSPPPAPGPALTAPTLRGADRCPRRVDRGCRPRLRRRRAPRPGGGRAAPRRDPAPRMIGGVSAALAPAGTAPADLRTGCRR
jgi:hypothetical protein